MTPFQAILLGIIQGVTEFLPISSDGHLSLAQALLGFTATPIFFDVFVHTATLLAVMIFFARQLKHLTRADIVNILLSLVPTGIIGLFFNRWIGTLYTSLPLAAAGFLVTTIFLFSSRFAHPQSDRIKPLQAILIGIIQGFAVLPGWSRSGSTISLALLLGISRERAFTFSFIASIPAILGAQAVQLLDLSATPFIPVYWLGFLAAGITGLISLSLLKRIVATRHFHHFAIYTLLIALFTLYVSF